MDYRLTDPWLDPPESDESCYSERSLRLPRTYWCYQPPEPSPDPGPLPALSAGQVTFGCLNNYCKVTDLTWSTWADLLAMAPGSRLIVHALRGRHRSRASDFLASRRIDPDRLEFVGLLAFDDYLRLHQRIDIALDPFPYPGGTTTCDALWMGVPVVSLAGQTAVSRAGLSILSNVGLPQLVARTTKEYVQTASELAADLRGLADLRYTLRNKMRSSPLMDPIAFCRNIEAAYRSTTECRSVAKD
jgi:predicted O-linked N-acetylglucosamine transferase (SPINDLY family)